MPCSSTTICFLSIAYDSLCIRERKCQNTMSPTIPIHENISYTKVIAILKGKYGNLNHKCTTPNSTL